MDIGFGKISPDYSLHYPIYHVLHIFWYRFFCGRTKEIRYRYSELLLSGLCRRILPIYTQNANVCGLLRHWEIRIGQSLHPILFTR